MNIRHLFIGCLIICSVNMASGQCIADYDFGTQTFGFSPDPNLGEQFQPAVLLQPYVEVLHMLIPFYILDIDSTLPLSPTTPLDSIELVSIVIVDLNDTLTTYTLTDLGLELICNNNGDSGNPCSFLGGNQYCASIEGTPFIAGNFRADITVKGWVALFGFAFGQEQLLGSITLDIGSSGCTDPLAINYDPGAVVDDGSCQTTTGCTADLDGDNSVTTTDIVQFLMSWGNLNPAVQSGASDINGDGNVTEADFLILLSNFGIVC